MANTRILVDEGRAQSPSPRQLLYALVRTVNGFYNKLSMSDKCWATAELLVDVDSGDTATLINAPQGFSRPLQLYTSYEANPSFIERYIPIFEYDSINFQWGLPQNWGYNIWSPDGSPNTALRAAFYWEGTNVYLKLQPIPQLSATYRLIYSVGNWMGSAGLESTPVLDNHHHLLSLKTALAILPLTKWFDDARENAERRKELAEFIKPEFEMAQQEFNDYIRQIHKAQVVMMSSSSIGRGYW